MDVEVFLVVFDAHFVKLHSSRSIILVVHPSSWVAQDLLFFVPSGVH